MADKVSSTEESYGSFSMGNSTVPNPNRDPSRRTDSKPGLPSAVGPLSSPCHPLPSPPTPGPAVSQPHGLSDQVYLLAATVFQMLHVDKPATQQVLRYGKRTDATLPECKDKSAERQAYRLAFSTLTYQHLLEDIMIDSCFPTSQQIPDDLLPLAMVMLFDFQDRKFSIPKRPVLRDSEPLQDVRNIEGSMYRWKTKLAASLACYRVKRSLLHISHFLSEPVRIRQDRAKLLPLYAWVNTLRTSVEEVCEALRDEGVCEVDCVSGLTGSTFCRDPLCPDTLVFPSHLRTLLRHSRLTAEHRLNLQDRSVCVAVGALRPLLSQDNDVLIAGSFSAQTVAYIAVLAAGYSGRVLVCGSDGTPTQTKEIQELLTHMNIKNVRVLPQEFCKLDECDATVQRLRVTVVLPQCSSSALNDPVDTILSEHGDKRLLQDLCQPRVSQSKIHTLANQQARILAHALNFSKVQTVVYCTRSLYPEENEELVKRVLEKGSKHPKLLPFRVSGPVLCQGSGSGPHRDTTADKFFRIQPSQHTNGCFIAQLTREADPAKVETVQDVLARAAAKGLLSGIVTDQSKPPKAGKRRKSRPPGIRDELLTSSQERSDITKTELASGEDLGNGAVLLVKSPLPEKGEVGDADSEEKDEEGVTEGEDERGDGEKKRGIRKGKVKSKQSSKQGHRNSKSRKAPASRSVGKASPRRVKSLHSKTPQAPASTKPTAPLPTLTSPPVSSHHVATELPLPDAPAKESPAKVSGRPTTCSHTPSDKHPSPARTPPTAVQRGPQRTPERSQGPERTGRPKKEVTKPGIQRKATAKERRPNKEAVKQVALKPVDFVLPPISSSSFSSLSSRSSSSVSLPPSRGSSTVPRPRFLNHHLPYSPSSSGLDKAQGPQPRPRQGKSDTLSRPDRFWQES